MARASESVTIRAPRDVVFAAVTDPRRTLEWNPNIVEIRDLSEHPARQGTTWAQTAMIMGRAVTLNCRIVRWAPPEMGLLEITGSQNAVVRTECHDMGGATRVVQTIDFKPPGGMLGAMAGGVIARQIEGELGRAMQRQRETLEREWQSRMAAQTNT